MASGYAVAIIGLGSRGCSIVERIVTMARLGRPGSPARVEIIDPTCEGPGLHVPDQPDYLLLNTLAGEISMFPGPESVGPDCEPPGPDLLTWVTGRGDEVRAGDFLPRRVLGEYLRWFFAEMCRRAPETLQITLHRSAAVDLASDRRDGVTVTLADGSAVHTDYAFLTLGHTGNEISHKSGVIADPYPLPDRLDRIAAGETVAVSGFGLSAMDVIASLTVGRGGRFDGEHYRASGEEPRILLHSRSGMPFRARPARAEMATAFPPIAFTRAEVARLRAAGPIDFDQAILPLLRTEMRISYHRCRTLLEAGPEAQQRLAADLTAAAGDGKLADAVDSLDLAHGGIDPGELWDGSAAMPLADGETYQRWLAGFLRDDLAHAVKGVVGSPVKAALEAIRDVRDFLRDAVNGQGLTPAAHDRFFGYAVPLMNRAVVGPQKERHHELLALNAAGLVRFPLGPSPAIAPDEAGGWTLTSTRLGVVHREHADWLCAGNASWPTVHASANPLVRALHRRGRLRRYVPGSQVIGAVDVDADLHPVSATGSDRRLWLIGPLCEGATFYNHLIPTPGYSRAFVDAHRCVTEMFEGER